MPPFLLGTFIQVNGIQLTIIHELHFCLYSRLRRL
jgi:hypothetical protein